MVTVDEAAATFWNIQRQWHGIGQEEPSITMHKALRALEDIKMNLKMPKNLRRMVAVLQRELINNTKPKKAKHSDTQPICSIISIR